MIIEGATATRVPKMYLRRGAEVLTNDIGICESAAHRRLRPFTTERFRHSIETADFSRMENTARHLILRQNLRQVFWNDDNDIFPKSVVRFVRIISDITASSLNSSILVSYGVHAALINLTTKATLLS